MAALRSVLASRVVAIILGDSAGGAGVPAHLIGSGTGDPLGDSLDILSKAFEDI
jgi:hypothetical protein